MSTGLVHGAGVEPGTYPVRPVHPGVRVELLIATALVFLAGVQLFVFSTRTEEYFAWTIASPLTAAFLGAGYWASIPLEFMAARERAWANARVAMPGVLIFTVMTLLTTLMHLDLFHLDSPLVGARLVTYAWLAIYGGVPILIVVLLLLQVRVPGEDPPRARPIPHWVQLVLGTQAALLLGVGLLMFLVPERMSGPWPWDVTALTGRAVASWLLGMGAGALQMFLERDWVRLRPASAGFAAFAVLQVIALLRYSNEIEPGIGILALLLFLASMLGVGLLGLLEGRVHSEPLVSGPRSR